MYSLLSALLNGLILATALTAAVWITLRLTPRRTLNAATRYVIWWITLAAALLIPLSLLPKQGHAAKAASAQSFTPAPVPQPAYIPPPPPAAIPIHISNPKPWPKWPLLIWPLISAILLIRLAASYHQLNRLKSRAQPVPAPRLNEWLARCKGARPGIRLALSNEIPTPIATGPNNPTILLPTRLFTELTDEDLDRIGLHETAHLVRRDDYALLFQRILEALFIPSPLILWIARRIDLEREIACDDLVIAATGRPRSYADCLTRIVECVDGISSPWPAATAAESVSQLARRVDALLDKTKRASAHLMKVRLAATTTLLIALALMATRSPALIAFVTTVAATAHHAIPILPLPAQTPTPAALTDDTLTGQVTEDNSGNPVPSAELRFHKPGLRELAADLETDRQGRFTAAGLPAGQYTIEVVKSNYAGTTFQLTVPAPRLSVRLVHYGVIDGEVHNASGDPMPAIIRAPGGRTIGSARLTILTKDPATGRLNTFREASLEEAGHYRIYDLPPGQYAIGLWYSGQNEGAGVQLYPDNTNPRLFSVAGGEEYDHIDFTVIPRPAAQISGRIEIPEGVKGQFQLALGLPDQPNLPLASVLSENDGTFHFDKIPPGTYDLFAAGPVGGYGAFDSILDAKVESFFGRTRIQSAGQNVEGVNLPVAPGKTLRVIVHAQPGCPASVRLNLTSLEPWAMMFRTNSEATPGKELSIPKLAPGLFRIAAADLGKTCFQTNDTVADLRGDSTEPAAIELAVAGSLHGRTSAANAALVLTSLSPTDATQRRVAYSDATGQFSFESLPPGRYKIAGKVIEVASGKPTEIEVAQ